jgi:hypothetical protein
VRLPIPGGVREMLRGGHPVVSLSTHGAPADPTAVGMLRDAGYAVEPIPGRERATASGVMALPAG